MQKVLLEKIKKIKKWLINLVKKYIIRIEFKITLEEKVNYEI